ncbi:MAG: BrnA antitoxin family protein [Clostridiales Family XIII bacterium]|nr:BrnA antitoxin family protein [Clostridiales Family XIII bacterium]
MRDEYDFSNGRPNPYLEKMKQQVTIRLEARTVAYFKEQAAVTGIPYQQLINFYLSDCASNGKKIAIV